uniref:Uncharacterized protein n=1 Tax=Anopheles culicifacies TaxID=139723 RepID=A0A182LZ03_9DIPT
MKTVRIERKIDFVRKINQRSCFTISNTQGLEQQDSRNSNANECDSHHYPRRQMRKQNSSSPNSNHPAGGNAHAAISTNCPARWYRLIEYVEEVLSLQTKTKRVRYVSGRVHCFLWVVFMLHLITIIQLMCAGRLLRPSP